MSRYVLDADISKCFDQISHPKLLTKLQTFPKLRRTIHAWLNAGILDGETFFPTTAGVTQGGPLSPLLANVALYGLETPITTAFPKKKNLPGGRVNWQPKVVVYADDFVILHRNLEVIQEAQTIAIQWFQEIVTRTEKMNSKATAVHHKEVLQTYPEVPLLIFGDRATWHCGETVRQVFGDNPRLEVIKLPVAAPDLNPQEHVWKAARSAGEFQDFLSSNSFPSSLLDAYGYNSIRPLFV